MEAMSILAPNERCVSAKLQLFLRLWVVRQKYEHISPDEGKNGERIRFHLSYLKVCWSKVVEFQKAIGLEILPFMPREEFELIYVISALIEHELQTPRNTIVDSMGRWRNYQTALKKLSHDLNPFVFGETCSYCAEVIRDLSEPSRVTQNPPLTLPPRIALDELPCRRLALLPT